jgi:hypothetical protein
MAIDEVIERSTIQFAKPLSLKETEGLLFHIAKNLPGDVNYQASHGEMITSLTPLKGKTCRERRSVSIWGTIYRKNSTLDYDSFECKMLNNNSLLFGSINFVLIPGYEFEEYRPGVVKLWGDVREQVSSYFKKEN